MSNSRRVKVLPFNLATVCVVLMVACPALADVVFLGPNYGLGVGGGGTATSWDVSKVVVADTPDGIAMSGSFTFSVLSVVPEVTDVFTLSVVRPLNPGQRVTMKASLSGDVAVSGSANVYNIGASASIPSFGACGGSHAAVNSGSVFGTLSGSFSDTGAPDTCTVPNGIPVLQLLLGVHHFFPSAGSGTITVDLGHTAIAEARLATVPEPASPVLLAGFGLSLLAFSRPLRRLLA